MTSTSRHRERDRRTHVESVLERARTPGRAVVVAEAGVNHDGDQVAAHLLVDVAAEAGADVVKFQTFVPDLLVSSAASTARYQRAATGETSQFDMLDRLALPAGAWAELKAHAEEVGLVFCSTAFDPRSADLLDELGVPLFKVPSGEITNLRFIRDLARRDRPLLISTGMADLAEVAAAVDAAAGAPWLVLLHCVSAYPAPVEESNLRAMVTLAREFGVPVGWSDHTEGATSAMVAVALGATVLEKHVTLDRSLPGPDHAASADPSELQRYVELVRTVERALGDGVKQPTAAEVDARLAARRSWHAARFLPGGTRLTAADVVELRPATGSSPAVDVVGWTVAHDVAEGAVLTSDAVLPAGPRS